MGNISHNPTLNLLSQPRKKYLHQGVKLISLVFLKEHLSLPQWGIISGSIPCLAFFESIFCYILAIRPHFAVFGLYIIIYDIC